MKSMNGFELEGRKISVEYAQGKKDEGKSGYKGRSRRDNSENGHSTNKRRNEDKPWRRSSASRDDRKRRYRK